MAALSISAKKWPNWNERVIFFPFNVPTAYPFLLRSGPIETSREWRDIPSQRNLSISAKKWPNWNLHWASALARRVRYPFLLRSGPIETADPHPALWCDNSLSISAKKWPNWNAIVLQFWAISPITLSISAKKWPNWNLNQLLTFESKLSYPFLLRSGPIETLLPLPFSFLLHLTIHFC